MNGLYINNFFYTAPDLSRVRASAYTYIPVEEIRTVSELERNEELQSKLSTRNGAGLFNIDVDRDQVWLPYYGVKLVVTDTELKQVANTNFEFFTPPQEVPIPAVILVKEGDIYRCAGEEGSPKPIDQYQYYMYTNEGVVAIPNYKTLEVLLYERQKSLIDVKVLEKSECMQLYRVDANGNLTDEMKMPEPLEDRSSAWKPEYQDFTSFEAYRNLLSAAESAGAAADAAAGAVQGQIDAANRNSDATKAQAEASAAQAEAAKAQAEAAAAAAAAQSQQAQAAAQQAAAQQAAAAAQEAEARRAQEEAEAKRLELELLIKELEQN